MSYQELDGYISVEVVIALYKDFANADSLVINIRLDEMLNARKKVAKLKLRREMLGLSQSELAQQSGIPLRTLQQYEQRRKNINNAKAVYLVDLASVLRCEVRDLIE